MGRGWPSPFTATLCQQLIELTKKRRAHLAPTVSSWSSWRCCCCCCVDVDGRGWQWLWSRGFRGLTPPRLLHVVSVNERNTKKGGRTLRPLSSLFVVLVVVVRGRGFRASHVGRLVPSPFLPRSVRKREKKNWGGPLCAPGGCG